MRGPATGRTLHVEWPPARSRTRSRSEASSRILAFCAAARGEPERARRGAKKALEVAADGTDFDVWLKRRRVAVPSLDLKAKEIDALRRLVVA